MAITISGENNNDRILASDGVIDQVSGINFSGIITASHINVGSNIQLGNAGIITATSLVGNVTGNINHNSNLLLQISGSEKFRVGGSGQLGIGGANYGTSGQVFTSGGSGSAATWTTIPAQASISNNANNRVITGGSGVNLNGEATLTYDGSSTLELQPASATPAIFIGDSNRTGAGQGLVQFRGNWNGTTVARITFDTGDDTTNKDDGFIRFDTSSTGSLVERVRINRSGNLGIGNVTSPDDKVEIRTSTNDQGVLIKSTGSSSNAIKFDANRSGANQGIGNVKGRWNGTTVAQMYMNTGDDTTDKNDGYIIFGTESAASNGNVNATERLRITSMGDVNIGNNAGYSIWRTSANDSRCKFQFKQTTGDNRGYALLEERGDSNCVDFFLSKSRGGNGVGAINSGDNLGFIKFSGADGTRQHNGAGILAWTSGTIATGRVPTNLSFYTAPDSVSNFLERLRITSDGNLVMNGASPNHDASSGSIFIKAPSGNPNRGVKWSDTSDTHYVKLEPSVIDGLTINGYSGVAFATGSRTNSTWAERLRINSSGHVVPATDSTYDLGLTGTRFRNVYADTLYGDGSNLTNLSAGAASYNAVINGEMLVSQRGSDWTSVGSSAYHLDRWYWYDQNSSCRVRIRHSGLSPDGFHQSYRVNCTTADTSIASNEEVKLIHKIEGYNLAPFAKGTSSAKKFTLSFYVKCNKTGTYCVELYDRDNGRDVSGSYTVSNTNWNRYTIDFPADTTGEFGFDNGSSLEIMFWLCAGSAVQGGSLNTSWRNSSDPGSATGQVNFMDSTSNEWALTGVQLEPTTTGTASDFKHEGLGETLSKCQRYYFAMCTDNYEILGTGHQYYSGNIFIPVYFPTTMRAEPTLEALAGSSGAYVYEKLFGNSPEYHHEISQETGKTGHNQSCIIMSGNNTRHGQTVRCAAHSFGSDTQRFVAFQAEL